MRRTYQDRHNVPVEDCMTYAIEDACERMADHPEAFHAYKRWIMAEGELARFSEAQCYDPRNPNWIALQAAAKKAMRRYLDIRYGQGYLLGVRIVWPNAATD